MATLFPGSAPEILTVSASPTPTSTVFTVSSATNLIQGQWINVEVSAAFERAKITGITGNQLTVTGLSGAPDVPGEVRNTRTLIAVSHIQGAGVFNASTVADLKTVDATYAPSGLKYNIPQGAVLGFNTVSGLTSDELSVFAPTTGTGQWVTESPSINLVESMIQEYCSPLLDEIEQLRIEVDRLNTLSAYAIEYYIITERPNIGILTTGTGTELLFPVVPAILTELRETDRISIQSFPLPAGVLVGGVSLQGGNISVRIHNPTAGSITPGVTPITMKIERVLK